VENNESKLRGHPMYQIGCLNTWQLKQNSKLHECFDANNDQTFPSIDEPMT
jgi:hypothetical protein